MVASRHSFWSQRKVPVNTSNTPDINPTSDWASNDVPLSNYLVAAHTYVRKLRKTLVSDALSNFVNRKTKQCACKVGKRFRFYISQMRNRWALSNLHLTALLDICHIRHPENDTVEYARHTFYNHSGAIYFTHLSFAYVPGVMANLGEHFHTWAPIPVATGIEARDRARCVISSLKP